MDEVLYGKDNGLATITINRPARRNSLTEQVVNMIRSSLARANHDPEIRAIVFTGEGNTVFCAGGDLGREAAESGHIARYDANKQLAELFTDIKNLSKPLIAKVNGHALGAGFAILLACDMVVAANDVRLGCPELKVGLFPMFTMVHLTRHLGPKQALEMMITAQQINAVEAERMGLINYAVSREELDSKTSELVEKIKDFSPIAIRLGRETFNATNEMDFSQALELALSNLSLNLSTEDAKEGTKAFLKKRKPVWSGK